MDKKNKKYKDDYSLRTLAYYQREGGIYNELITILQRIRAEKGNGRRLAPAKVLNQACEIFDRCIEYNTEEDGRIVDYGFEDVAAELWGGCIAGPMVEYNNKDQILILCTVLVLSAQVPAFKEATIPDLYGIIDQDKLLNYFKPLVDELLSNEPSEIETLKRQLASRDTIINFKDSQIADMFERLSEQEKVFENLHRAWELVVKKPKISDFNEQLSLENILEWIKNRKHYTMVDQVFVMLKDLGYKVATDDEHDKILNLENEMIANHKPQSIVNNNMGIGSNFLTGLAQNPMMPFGITPEQLTQRFIEFINNGARRENKD